MLPRRKFLQLSGTALTAAVTMNITGCSTAYKPRPWGIQLFSIPQMVAADFAGTLAKLSTLGYKEIEFFGPYAFSAPATIERWKPLAEQLGIGQNAFYGFTVSDARKMLTDNGLMAPAAHLDLGTLRTNLHEASKNLTALGARYVVVPTLMETSIATADDYKKLAEEFNAMGKQMKEHGVRFVYHNHGYEHAPKDGEIPMDILLTNTDSETVMFELDIFWMQAAGASPVDYLKKYPGRFKLMHVKDAAEAIRFSGDGSTPDQWMALFPKMADPGSGVLNVKSIIETGIQSGVEHFFLERDLAPKPDETLKNSIAYFKTLG